MTHAKDGRLARLSAAMRWCAFALAGYIRAEARGQPETLGPTRATGQPVAAFAGICAFSCLDNSADPGLRPPRPLGE
jgi:hypothetical protein